MTIQDLKKEYVKHLLLTEKNYAVHRHKQRRHRLKVKRANNNKPILLA